MYLGEDIKLYKCIQEPDVPTISIYRIVNVRIKENPVPCITIYKIKYFHGFAINYIYMIIKRQV